MESERNKQHFTRKTVILTTALGLSFAMPTAFAATSVSGSGFASVSSSASEGTASAAAAEFPKPLDPKITKDEAVDTVRTLFPALKDAKVQDVQLGDHNSYPPQNQNAWTIQWQFVNGNNSYGFNSQVDSQTGELLQTQINDYPSNEKDQAYYPPKYSRADALGLAKVFIHKASPSLAVDSLQTGDQIKYSTQPLFGPVRYDFFFAIPVNGVKSSSESLYITVDGNGQVIGYNRHSPVTDYPSAVPKVSLDEAAKKYESAAKLSLQYIPQYRFDAGVKQWFLSWAPPAQADASIDAQTGDYLNSYGDPIQPSDVQYIDVPKTSDIFAPIAGTGDNSLLTAEEAEAAVQRIAPIPQNRTLSFRNLGSDNGIFSGAADRKSWRLNWTEQAAFQPYSKQSSATVDARTGQLLDFTMDMMRPPYITPDAITEPAKEPINEQQANDKAMQLLNRIYPNASEELKWVNPDPNAGSKAGSPTSFSYLFQRVYQGIPVIGDSVTLSLDVSGRLIAYRNSRSNGFEDAVKSLKANMTPTDAAAAYFSNTSETLEYRIYGGFYSDNNYRKPIAKLVYARYNKDVSKIGYTLDATDGQWRPTYVGPPAEGDGVVVMPTDIAAHWAHKDLETMVQYQILKPDSAGNLKPDAPVMLGDWMDMMAHAVNPRYAADVGYMSQNGNAPAFQDVDKNNPYYAAAQIFSQYRWLDAAKTPILKPDQPLTRERLAESVIAILHYDKLAGFLQQPVQFKDADKISAKGAVSLAVGLGLFSRDSAMFHPDQPVSKAEAATVLMQLVRLQGRTDQQIGS